MAGVFDDEIAMALELIAENGQVCDWYKQSVELEDEDKPWLGGTNTPTKYTPSICFVPATSGDSGFGITKFRKDTEVPEFTTYGLMGAVSFTPQVTDLVERNSQPLVIVSIDVLQPNEQIILYILGIM